ncbi:MAG: Uma2 family endonuclease [Deltaproteobacteria bacterium]|nr:Uma2 family endonuclease [Deltaproteobacteria bacterium]
MNTSTEMVLPATPHAWPPEPAQRVILHGVSWGTYERLLADFQDSHAAHFTYDRGALEIMVLSFKHEIFNRALATLIETLAEELQIDFINAGSTTFKREDLARGFEPDSCFYIQNEERVRGKKELNLLVDPPPDIVIEIDISSLSLNKFSLYAQLGIPEVWRYDGNRVFIFKREGDQYTEVDHSMALPLLTSVVATRFLEESAELRSTVWLRQVREWARQQGRL